MKPMIVTVTVYKDPLGYWWADSDDLFGLYVWERTKRELLSEIPVAIKELLERNGYVVESVRERPALPMELRRPKKSSLRRSRTVYIAEGGPMERAEALEA